MTENIIIDSILKSSSHIHILYDNDNDNLEDVKTDSNFSTYIKNNIFDIYTSYKNTIKNPLDFDKVIEYINKFEKMNIHNNFVKATSDEYFNKSLNYFLIIDFIISFNKNDMQNSKNIDHNYIFKLFVDLSYFYKFMNYLDVVSSLLDYIKTLLVLYLQSLDRYIIESFFSHVIWILDDFFKYEVVKPLLFDKLNPEYNNSKEILLSLETKYSKELLDCDNNIDYTTPEYDHLNLKFYANFNHGEFNCKRVIKNNYSFDSDATETGASVYDSDFFSDETDSSESESDSDSDYIQDPIQYAIEETDIYYELYKKQFILRHIQEHKKIIVNIENQINELIKNIKIKDLNLKTKLNNEEYFIILTYIGETLDDYKIYSLCEINEILNIAYTMGYFNIVKTIVETTEIINLPFRLHKFFNYKEINDYLKSKFTGLKENENVGINFTMKI